MAKVAWLRRAVLTGNAPKGTRVDEVKRSALDRHLPWINGRGERVQPGVGEREAERELNARANAMLGLKPSGKRVRRSVNDTDPAPVSDRKVEPRAEFKRYVGMTYLERCRTLGAFRTLR